MTTKAEDQHLKKALPDEPIFVLLARDITAPEVVAEWIKKNLALQPAEKLHEALDCAIKMAQENETIRAAAEQRKRDEIELKFGEEF